jgi:drug/metabolite transporter (DMT)-like permease
MLGQWVSEIFSSKSTTSLMKRFQSHYTSLFRELLLGGILFILVGLLIFQPVFQHHREYYLWLAGLAAILGTAFLFAIMSTRINGYRRYKDSLLGFATGMMFLLCSGLAIIWLFHL